MKDIDQSDYQKEDQKTIKNNNLTAKDVITATIGHEIGQGNKNNQNLINSKSDSEKEPHCYNNQILKDLAKKKK